MLSDEDLKDLQRFLKRTIRDGSIVYNNEIDANKLPDAIAAAIVQAIKYYDQLRG